MAATYKLIIVSFAVMLSTVYILIDGHEIALFLFLYLTHLWASTYVKDDTINEDDPFDLLRYRPAIMR